MRDLAVTLALVVSFFVALVAEHFIAPLGFLSGARVTLVPMLFCYGALRVPFPLMLLLAVAAGFLTDLSVLQVVAGKVEIAVGWSIIFFVAVGSICQGMRNLFVRGHWELHALASALATVALLAIQFGLITMRRFDSGGVYFSETVAWRIAGPGIIALILAPPFCFLANALAGYRKPAPRPVRGI